MSKCSPSPTDAERLRRFNLQMLDQALTLVAAHERPGSPPYDGPVGAHLRHVIEHFDALLLPARKGEVDYDARLRDRALERSPLIARQRLQALQQRFMQLDERGLDAPLRVHGRGGAGGEFAFTVASSLGRELVFVASHAVHHYALLHAHCKQHGIATAADFGKAPATIAHQRCHQRSVNSKHPAHLAKEPSCQAQAHSPAP